MSNISTLKIHLDKNYILLLLIGETINQNIVLFICMEWDQMCFKEVCSLSICLKMLLFVALILVVAEKVKENVVLLVLNIIGILVSMLLPRFYYKSFEKIRIQKIYFMGTFNGSFCQFSLYFHSFFQ